MRFSLLTLSLLFSLPQKVFGDIKLIGQIALSKHTNMSDANAPDSRVSLGAINPKLRDCRFGDWTQVFLDEVFMFGANCNLHSDGCWGYYVVRTCFAEGDDQRVAQAMARLDEAAAMRVKFLRHLLGNQRGVFEDADADAIRRFHNVLIDDKELRDADISKVRRYLEAWFATIPEPKGGARWTTFILLDSQVLDNLNRLPEKFSMEQWEHMRHNPDYQWVKLVDVGEDWGQTCRIWIWELQNAFSLISKKDYGLSEIARTDHWVEDPDWAWYQAV